jgi:hypothetical protein
MSKLIVEFLHQFFVTKKPVIIQFVPIKNGIMSIIYFFKSVTYGLFEIE